jgi:glycine oxidase
MKVVVIGAGVAGLGIGLRLAQAGASVTVLERAQVGNGATSSSAGMIAASAEYGLDNTPETDFARHASELWPSFADELQQTTGVDIGYRKSGSLLVRMKSAGVSATTADGEVFLAEQARKLEPMLGDNVGMASLAPQDAQVDSQALCRALAIAFIRAGGKLHANETAVRFERTVDEVTGIATPFTTHRGDAFILAAGAWSARLEGLPPEAVPPVTPVKGEIAVLTPPAGAALPQHVVWGNGIYLTPRRGRLLVGATVELAGFDTSLSQAALRWLYQQSTGLMPALADWRLTEHWAGLRPGSPDGLPILGETALEGLFVASGQFRNGILFAPAVAEVVSRLVLERVAIDPAFEPRRFDGMNPRMAESVVETPHKNTASGAGAWRMGY